MFKPYKMLNHYCIDHHPLSMPKILRGHNVWLGITSVAGFNLIMTRDLVLSLVWNWTTTYAGESQRRCDANVTSLLIGDASGFQAKWMITAFQNRMLSGLLDLMATHASVYG